MHLTNLTDLFALDNVLVLDLETTVQDNNGKTDNSPFNRANRAVGAWWLWVHLGRIGPCSKSVWHHNEKPLPDSRDELQNALDQAKLIVAHNAKFDIIWLLEMGFKISCPIFCTMIGEFIYARGQFFPLSLKETAIRRDVTRKKSDLVDEMFKEGIGFEAMPLDTVDEYAEADVISCAEIFIQQIEDLQQDENKGLAPVFLLMMDNMQFLVEIERNGIKIDLEALARVKEEFIQEREELTKRLNEIARGVLGDSPFNLSSGKDQCKIVYSREVIDRELHTRIFNIGVGRNNKPLPPPRMSKTEFSASVRATTRVVKKTMAECCPLCNGSGKQYKVTKKGVPYKKQPNCKTCDGGGAIYISTGQTAGLKLSPLGPKYASVHGFKVDKTTIKVLITQAEAKGRDLAVEYLTKLSRLNAVNTYINSFITGIETWVREDGILHANFNQTVARTARLSSSNPNFQNLPKSGNFPVRKCIISRFEGQSVIEADFSGLEFRIAGELSRDPQIIDDILSGKDVHKQTASIINQIPEDKVTKDLRQKAKAYTFAPLYGGQGAQESEHVKQYFKQYFSIYKGLKNWHEQLFSGVLKNGIVRTPSGREFYFPDAKRQRNGRITNSQQVVNYPVQSFATGDCVPLACIRLLCFFRNNNLRSKIILTVHDSIVVDCYAGEQEKVVEGITWAMQGVGEDLVSRFNYEPILPLDIEIEAGKNWMEMAEIH